MNANETKVDVLAVMERAEDEQLHRFEVAFADEIRQARAAVAELIEAAAKASATLGHAYHTVLLGEIAEYAREDYQRLDAALARIGGAA